MNDDELRRRLEGIDPLLDGPDIDPITSPTARTLLEDIMHAPVHAETETISPPADPLAQRSPRDSHRPDPARRRLALVGAAAALIATVAVGAALFGGGDDGSVATPVGTAAPAKLKVLELSTGDTDPAMMSCLPVSSEIVAMAPVAFRAVVDTVDGEIVTMTIDRWYTGGDAQVVTLTAPAGMEALIGGIDFAPGDAVLITANDGVVGYCGMSGLATPELQAVFDQAFPG